MTRNWMKVLVLLLAVVMMSPIAALAEEDVQIEAPAVEQVEAPKAEAPKAEAPKAEEPKAEEPKVEEVKVEAPKAEEPKAEAPVEEIVAEAEEAAEPEIIVEAGEEVSEEIEIEEEETPLGVFPVEDAATGFSAMVKVELKDEKSIYFGDKVVLVARVTNANAPYTLRWEVNRQDGKGWKTIPEEREPEYDFIITPENASYEYRVVLAA